MLVDSVYDRLMALIMDQQIRPGSKISIDALVRELGVSSTPIREALARLEADGLVLKESMRGYFATEQLSAAEFDDLCQFREVVEGWAVSTAALRATKADIEALQAELDTVPRPLDGDDYESFRRLQEHDVRFHMRLLQIAGNQALTTAFQRTHPHVRTFRLRYEAKQGNSAIREHEAIVAALRQGDPKGAQDALISHIRATANRIRPWLDT
ncbi:GntR family transcriptional regulator [Pseudactinotalea suaedae]|uniref:GntR family transcriptional regulator n=1 Tax=Pseudactinotalea suaedae TaxID=1524924 RepID=UPI0013915472|nr:GntR family transcriptional regulator [Pseudactinotalea suaedae]